MMFDIYTLSVALSFMLMDLCNIRLNKKAKSAELHSLKGVYSYLKKAHLFVTLKLACSKEIYFLIV